jgi:hypothetical protein
VFQGNRRATQPPIQETNISQICCEIGQDLLWIVEQLTCLNASRNREEGRYEIFLTMDFLSPSYTVPCYSRLYRKVSAVNYFMRTASARHFILATLYRRLIDRWHE